MDWMIEVRDLRYRYPRGETNAVDGMTFEIGAGEIFGLLGPSGAGKTTTQQILIGLIHGWAGEVTVFGRPLQDWRRALYDRIGVSFELPAGYSRLSGREDLDHFAALHDKPTRDPSELLEAVGLGDAADRSLGAYSKGMRTRLNLARSLVHDPDLLFLDEPTGGLDPTSVHRVRDLILAERATGKTIFLTTHDMTTADELCDRVAFVVDGRIVACDTPRALRLVHGTPEARVDYRRGSELVSATFPLNGDNDELATLLRAGQVETIHSSEAGLDDVFVTVTGSRL